MPAGFPTSPDGLTLEILDRLVRTTHPQVSVAGFEVTGSWTFEDGAPGHVSTAGRIALRASYDGVGADELPEHVMIKVNRPALPAHPLYRNEVAFYSRLRPELDADIETPRCIGAAFDDATNTFALALEDIAVAGADFWNATRPVGVEHLSSLLDLLARLHATYWSSPRFAQDLAWLQPHVEGELHTLFTDPQLAPSLIAHEVQTVQFKRELVESIGETVDSLAAKMQRVQEHQATLPRTVCHGDAHIGNTYLLDGRPGLLDWQLTAIGHAMHDVHYVIVTGLSVAQRRRHERALLAHYLDRLAAHGAGEAPSPADAWDEYRRAIVWGLYVGWLTTPVSHYGWEITVANHIRLATAYRDLDTAAAIAELA